MKKLLLGIFTLGMLATATAQIEIYEDGIGPDVSGTIVTKTVDATTSFPLLVHFHVVNNTGMDQQIRVVRFATVGDLWRDDVCWPPTCYTVDDDLPAVENIVSYITPNSGGSPAPIIMDGTDSTTTGLLAELKPQIYPDQSSNNTGIYKYYLSSVTTGEYLDSVELHVTYLVGLDEMTPVSVQVSPNPATDELYVVVSGDLEGDLKMVDVLGNVVYKGKAGVIDVSSFNNGMYFIIAEDKAGRLSNHKVMVRH